MKLLKKVAAKGTTVISTIHSPGSDAFALFDTLLLMVDGNIVYQGLASESAEYFKSIGFNLPKYSNPADYYMKILTVGYPMTDKEQRKVKFLVDNYEEKILPK